VLRWRCLPARGCGKPLRGRGQKVRTTPRPQTDRAGGTRWRKHWGLAAQCQRSGRCRIVCVPAKRCAIGGTGAGGLRCHTRETRYRRQVPGTPLCSWFPSMSLFISTRSRAAPGRADARARGRHSTNASPASGAMVARSAPSPMSVRSRGRMHKHEIQRPVADDLVRDVDLAALRVSGGAHVTDWRLATPHPQVDAQRRPAAPGAQSAGSARGSSGSRCP
jgi:hypothetical protein